MMKKFPNFYETLQEACMRLDRTVVLYDGIPYFVLCITDHKGDGIFRMYLDKLDKPYHRSNSVPNDWMDEPEMSKGKKMDLFLEQRPDCGILRKKTNSPLFNKFRPFPLGMVNVGTYTIYTERSPSRSTHQGLKDKMLSASALAFGPNPAKAARLTPMGQEFYDMIVGDYPTAQECVANLVNPEIENTVVAFDRNFCIYRGPIDTLFLGYKRDIIGILPDNDLSRVTLGREFTHLRETVLELNVFGNVLVNN